MKRGFLVQALLLLVLLFVLCLAILGRQTHSYSAARQSLLQAQARALAVAGVENLRVKLNKDYEWRRLGQVGAVSYVEEVRDPQGGTRVGAYRVTLNQVWSQPDFEVLKIESEGLLGDLEKPEARLVISALMDIRPEPRSGAGSENPDLFRFIEWNERIP